MTITHTKFAALITISVLLLSFLVTPLATSAATMTLSSEPSNLMQLKAKVTYLKAYLDALLDGERSVKPTFEVAMFGSSVNVVGTLMAEPNLDTVEVCGPMAKGSIDWGDGTIEPIMGLGCSGTVHSFGIMHEYTTSGAYKIIVADNEGRVKKHNVAVRVK